MSEKIKPFRKGEWVSHQQYGVGQVEGKEKKALDGESKEYYKVSTRNGIYWIPTDSLDPSRIRPVVSEDQLQKALAILESHAEEMDSKYTDRKSRINQVITEGDLEGYCELLRDLSGKRAGDKLNATEQRAHTIVKKKIASEWSATREISLQDATKEINKLLRGIKAPEKSPRQGKLQAKSKAK